MKHELAIDFGSIEFRAAVPSSGIVVRQPTCVAIDSVTGDVKYFGKEALLKSNTNPDAYRLRYPFRSGWIIGEGHAPIASDFMMRARGQVYAEASDVRLLFSIPCGLSDEEEYAVAELGHRAGFGEAYLVYSPVAALVGSGYSLEHTYLAVNVGASFTDIALISDGNLLYRASHPVSGMSFNDAIGAYVSNRYHLRLRFNEAERIKNTIGTVWSDEEKRTIEMVGSDAKGAVHRALLSSEEMFTALEEPCAELLDAIHTAAMRVPLEAVEGLMKTGILLFGGGARLRGLPEMISGITGFRTTLAEAPEDAVAEGLAKILPTLPAKLPVPNVSAIACKTNSYLY
ncbi:MAG: hypothetical protein E7609_05610 [Ruminococcaceae bacterium]|nr:hypothetical protein [Oscillospiraceae bacterium]